MLGSRGQNAQGKPWVPFLCDLGFPTPPLLNVLSSKCVAGRGKINKPLQRGLHPEHNHVPPLHRPIALLQSLLDQSQYFSPRREFWVVIGSWGHMIKVPGNYCIYFFFLLCILQQAT